jgi:hypothetical protein
VLELKLAQAGLLRIEKVRASPLASLAVGLKEYDLPTVAVGGGEPLMVGGELAGTTVIENDGRAVLVRPSLTLMTMFE